MRKTLLLALAAAALTAASVTPAAAQEPPTTADLCALATADTIARIRATPELDQLVPAGLSSGVAAAGARLALGCDGQRPDPAAAKVRVCAALTVPGLTAFATRLGATPGVKANITAANVAAARRAVACTDPATPGGNTDQPGTTTTPPGGTGATPTPPATPSGGGFTQVGDGDVPVGGVDTGA